MMEVAINSADRINEKNVISLESTGYKTLLERAGGKGNNRHEGEGNTFTYNFIISIFTGKRSGLVGSACNPMFKGKGDLLGDACLERMIEFI